MSHDFEEVLGRCEETLELMEEAFQASRFDILMGVNWERPVTSEPVSPEMRRRLSALLDMTSTMQRRVVTRMDEMGKEIDRTADVKKASAAYLRTAPAAG